MSVAQLDLTTARTPSEYIAWFSPILEQISEREDNREAALLHENEYKFFYEELFPLYCLLKLKEQDWSEARFQPIKGNQSYDVKVEGLPIEFLEITTTNFDGDERFRMQQLMTEGSVDALNPICHDERGRPVGIQNEGEMRDHQQLIVEETQKIHERITRKNSRTYPSKTALLVYYNDYKCYPSETDRSAFEALVNELHPQWSENFTALFLVGAKGEQTFEWLTQDIR
ncbi:hypothetical protein SH580_02535 [Coraliomargarita algicola]|uniref:Uncharacterized protein n=1 Tax=Coraliomargarita algicola TaxID=3092156 RepID=A0ABZ0RMY5_9BACT|nr:hypothetical protein [Coraliomargarita sp. J2-16]WPJ96579.1 hypothetical protein SH580_02535 [Coraliomargarita sp. J2-16]